MIPKNEPVKREIHKGIKMYLQGSPMIGKTFFASQWPKPIFFNTDGNVKQIDSPVVEIKNWPDFVSSLNELLEKNEQAGYQYETIVIDLIDEVYNYARDYYLKALDLMHESDLGYGKAYQIIRTKFLSVINLLKTSKFNVLYLDHENKITEKNRKNEDVVVNEPSINSKIYTKIKGSVDIAARAEWLTFEDKDGNETNMRIITLTDANSQTSNRFNLPERIALDYKKLIEKIKETKGEK